MEQDIKVGQAGEVAISESVAAESVKGSLVIGPIKLDLVASIDNKALLELVAAKLPGGLAHDAVKVLEAALFPAAPAPSAV